MAAMLGCLPGGRLAPLAARQVPLSAPDTTALAMGQVPSSPSPAPVPRMTVASPEPLVRLEEEQRKRQNHRGGSGQCEALKNHPGPFLLPLRGAHFWVLVPQILSISRHHGCVLDPSSHHPPAPPPNHFWSLAYIAFRRDTMEKILGKPMALFINSTDGNAVVWSIGDVPIVTKQFKPPVVDVYHEDKFKLPFAVSEDGRVLNISQLTEEDSGIYSAKTSQKTSTFTIRVSEPTVTCEVQNCSHGFCACCVLCLMPDNTLSEVCSKSISCTLDLPRSEGPGLQEKESSWKELNLLMCRAQIANSNQSITVTTRCVLHNGADSDSSGVIIAVSIAVSALVVVLLIFLGYCKSRVPCLNGRCWGSAGDYRIASDNQAEESV